MDQPENKKYRKSIGRMYELKWSLYNYLENFVNEVEKDEARIVGGKYYAEYLKEESDYCMENIKKHMEILFEQHKKKGNKYEK